MEKTHTIAQSSKISGYSLPIVHKYKPIRVDQIELERFADQQIKILKKTARSKSLPTVTCM